MTEWMQRYVANCKGYGLYKNPRIWHKKRAIAKLKRELAFETDYGDFSYSNESNPFYNDVQDDLYQINLLKYSNSHYAWRIHNGFTLMPEKYSHFMSSRDYSPEEISKLTY